MTVDNVLRHDVFLLPGNRIARVGFNYMNIERDMERHEGGDLKDNGGRVISLSEENNLIIDGTLFTHRNIHKLTLMSPDGVTQCHIHHITFCSKWRCRLHDVAVMRLADIDSDVYMLAAKMILMVSNTKVRMARNQRPDISILKDALIKEKYSIRIRIRFGIFHDETALTNDDLNTAMMESAKEIIEYTKTCKSEWIIPDTWRTIEEWRQMKTEAL